MKPPKQIQLALQGGGAKIYALIAALKAVEDAAAVKDGSSQIKVSRIAGTSAGALVGCLYAAGVPVDAMRSAFATLPVDRVFRHRLPLGVSSRISLFVKAWRNRALADMSPVRELLTRLLRDASKRSDPTLGDLPIPVVVLAS